MNSCRIKSVISSMNEIQGKTISIYFSDYEIPLLNEFNQLCRRTYATKTGWVKRKIHEELRQVKSSKERDENH